MRLHVTTDPLAIGRLAERALADDPVANTEFSSIVAALRRADADGWCAYLPDRPGVLAVRSQTHTPVALSTGWDDVTALGNVLASLPSLDSLGGPVETVTALVLALEQRGLVVTSRTAERLFRLDELAVPSTVVGAARLACADDLATLTVWFEAFAAEAFGRPLAGFDGARLAERALRRSRIWLWADAVGTVGSMAVRQPAAHGVSRIGPVYTRPDVRRRGFGSAVTAAATRDALREGIVPVLYTDVANPTSNKIYQELGYYSVTDRLAVSFC